MLSMWIHGYLLDFIVEHIKIYCHWMRKNENLFFLNDFKVLYFKMCVCFCISLLTPQGFFLFNLMDCKKKIMHTPVIQELQKRSEETKPALSKFKLCTIKENIIFFLPSFCFLPPSFFFHFLIFAFSFCISLI